MFIDRRTLLKLGSVLLLPLADKVRGAADVPSAPEISRPMSPVPPEFRHPSATPVTNAFLSFCRAIEEETGEPVDAMELPWSAYSAILMETTNAMGGGRTVGISPRQADITLCGVKITPAPSDYGERAWAHIGPGLAAWARRNGGVVNVTWLDRLSAEGYFNRDQFATPIRPHYIQIRAFG